MDLACSILSLSLSLSLSHQVGVGAAGNDERSGGMTGREKKMRKRLNFCVQWLLMLISSSVASLGRRWRGGGVEDG